MADPQDDSTQSDVARQAGAVDAANQSTPTGSQSIGTGDDRLNTKDIEMLLDQAADSLKAATGEKVSAEAKATPFSLGDLTPQTDSQSRQPIDLLGEVEMDLRIELGRTLMRLDEVLQLRSGSVVALDKLAGDPVDVFVNGRLIARGEVLVMNDNFCIRVTELVGA